MKEGIEIEIWHRWCDLDKVHEYSVVCRERDMQANYSSNGWIFWLWYHMGESLMNGLRKNEKQKFRLIPFANTWDEKCKPIKEYKEINSGDRVVPAILSHFKKVKSKR
jgi:hypothetical protein